MSGELQLHNCPERKGTISAASPYKPTFMTMNQQTYLTEAEIDEIVTAEADDDTAWEEAIQIEKPSATPLSIPQDLADRALFLATLHREKSLDAWLTRVIRERVELEESAFLQAKRDLAPQS